MHNEFVTTNKERKKLHVAVFKAKRRHFTAAKLIDHSSSINRQLQQEFYSECLIAEVHLLVANNQRCSLFAIAQVHLMHVSMVYHFNNPHSSFVSKTMSSPIIMTSSGGLI
jgi:hypothetical protein